MSIYARANCIQVNLSLFPRAFGRQIFSCVSTYKHPSSMHKYLNLWLPWTSWTRSACSNMRETTNASIYKRLILFAYIVHIFHVYICLCTNGSMCFCDVRERLNLSTTVSASLRRFEYLSVGAFPSVLRTCSRSLTKISAPLCDTKDWPSASTSV